MDRFISRLGLRQPLRLAGDLAGGVAAFYAAFLLRIRLPLPLTLGLLPEDRLSFFFTEWWVIALSQPLTLYFLGFYDPPSPADRAELPRRLLPAVTFQGLGLMGYYFLTNGTFPRSVLVLFMVVNFAVVLGWRRLLLLFDRPARRRVAIVGSNDAALELAATIRVQADFGLELVGFVPAPHEIGDEESQSESESEAEAPEAGETEAVLGPSLGRLDDLPRLLAADQVDDIILAASSYPWQTELMDRLAGERPAHSNVLLLPGPFESLIGRMRYRWVQDLPLIEVVRETEWRVNRPLKRLLDLVAGTLLLALALPFMAVCWVLVRATSPGPAIYRQTRLGIGRQPFELWKFRTMHRDAERATGVVLATPNDPRLTAVGGFLRRLRLDELPQLFHVLAGTMSLVGPRPERPVFVERFLSEVPGYAERFTLAPGLTGLAQINGNYHSSAQNKLRYDLAYMANWSLWLDLSILLRTIKIVLTSRGT